MSRLAIAALVLVVAADALVLAGVASNRAVVEASLELTERELWLDAGSEENIGMSLVLSWDRDLQPMSVEAITALGFDCSVPPSAEDAWQHYDRQPSRTAYVVLEMDGPAWQRQLAAFTAAHPVDEATFVQDSEDILPAEAARRAKRQAQANARWLVEKRQAASRLIAIDLGTDATALRSRYPNAALYAIVAGRIGIRLVRTAIESEPMHLDVYLYDLLVDRIHVDHRRRAFFEALARDVPIVRVRRGDWTDPAEITPRFAATVAFGARFEPWIVDLTRLP